MTTPTTTPTATPAELAAVARRFCVCGVALYSRTAVECPNCETRHAVTTQEPDVRILVSLTARPAYRFDALATRDALDLLQRASVAAGPVTTVQEMTYHARDRFNAEMRAYLRGE